jgi:hypothetical protein
VGEHTEIEGAAQADWTQRGSRILEGERRVLGSIERWKRCWIAQRFCSRLRASKNSQSATAPAALAVRSVPKFAQSDRQRLAVAINLPLPPSRNVATPGDRDVICVCTAPNVGSSCAAPQGLGLHENVLLGRRDILMVSTRRAEAPVLFAKRLRRDVD